MLTVLIVESERGLRETAETVLGVAGYRTFAAAQADEALAVLREHPEIDLLFTDIAMPEGLNGFQVAEAARALRPGLKVLFTTGYAGMPDTASPADWRDRLIRKPYRRLDLAEKIRTALSC